MDNAVYNEKSKPSLELHIGVVEVVHDSGLVDIRSTRGKMFREINVLRSGVEATPNQGVWAVVLSDGAQHIALGEINGPADQSSGETVRNVQNDLYDLEDSKVIMTEDDLGNQARVIVSKGAGVLIDGGQWSVTHHDVGNEKLAQYYKKIEQISSAHYARHGVVESPLNAKVPTPTPSRVENYYEFRTKASRAAMQRNMRGRPIQLRNPKNSVGETFVLDMSAPQPEKGDLTIFSFEMYPPKIPTPSFSVKLQKTGNLVIQNQNRTLGQKPQSSIVISTTSGKVNVTRSPKTPTPTNAAIAQIVETHLASIYSFLTTHTHSYVYSGGTATTTPPVTPSAGALSYQPGGSSGITPSVKSNLLKVDK